MTKTKDYGKFKLKSYNRDVDYKHVEVIKDSIRRIGYKEFLPIIVNNDFEILDGQHRYAACKELDLPITYKVVDEKSESLVKDLNEANRNWSVTDSVKYWANVYGGDPNYILLQKTCNTLKISPRIALVLSQGYECTNLSKKIKDGRITFSNTDAEQVTEIYVLCRRLSEALRIPLHTRLAEALLKLSKHKNFKEEILFEKAGKYPTLAYVCRTKNEYYQMLKDLYNYNARRQELRIGD